jgi:glutamate/tyrosine decarboxylase-like PLP-dependent enzyme
MVIFNIFRFILMTPESDHLLELSTEQMKKLGYFEDLKGKPVTRYSTRSEMEKKFREPIPYQKTNPDEILKYVNKEIFGNIMHVDHPRFFAFVPSPSNFISVLADCLVSAFNPFAGTWLESAPAAQIELVTVDWLKKIFDMPNEAGGLFLSGGSTANMLGLAVARQIKLNNRIENSVIYYSDQTHSSIDRALKVLGFSENNICKIPSNEEYKLNIDLLVERINEDKKNGLIPFCIVGNAGNTNTGSVDSLMDISNLCKMNNLWFHIDGAYGAASILDSRSKALLDGIGKADSLCLDPHKWWFQPYEISCLIVRDSSFLKKTFRILPEYLKDLDRATEEINFCDYGTQLTRSFRAMKFWMSLKCFGLNSFKKAVTRGIDLAEHIEKICEKHQSFEIISPPQIGIITFRFVVDDLDLEDINEINKAIIEKMIDDGYAMISTTKLNDKVVLRMCAINPRIREIDIERTISKIVHFGKEIVKKMINQS